MCIIRKGLRKEEEEEAEEATARVEDPCKGQVKPSRRKFPNLGSHRWGKHEIIISLLKSFEIISSMAPPVEWPSHRGWSCVVEHRAFDSTSPSPYRRPRRLDEYNGIIYGSRNVRFILWDSHPSIRPPTFTSCSQSVVCWIIPCRHQSLPLPCHSQAL